MYESDGTSNSSMNYIWDGDKLIAQKCIDSEQTTIVKTIYDTDEESIGLIFRQYDDETDTGEQIWLYRKNLQGDVTGVIDGFTGALGGSFTYDAYGMPGFHPVNDNQFSILSSAFTFVMLPQIYRGYTYFLVGNEICYYLGSRFYSPRMGRFLNADDVDYIGIGTTPISCNMYTYCFNDPVNDADPSGHLSIKTITNYIKSLGNSAYNVAKKLINNFVWKPNFIGLKLFEILIDSLLNFMPFSYAFKFVGYKAVTKQLVKIAFQNSKKHIMTFLTKIGVSISFNTIFTTIVNGVIFKYASRLLTVGGIICLVLDRVDGKVDYWFEYGKFK